LFPVGVGLYFIVQSLSKDNIYNTANIIHLHHRMGHIDITSLLHMQQHNLVEGLPPKKLETQRAHPKISHIPPLVMSLVDLVILNLHSHHTKRKANGFLLDIGMKPICLFNLC
jgi:hypothetical protein